MKTTNLHHVVAALEAAGVKSRACSRVEVYSDEYYLSHGKHPGGFGGWAFRPMGRLSPVDALMVREVVGKLNEQPGLVGRASFDGKILFMPCSTYGEAKTAAVRLFAALGFVSLQVCT